MADTTLFDKMTQAFELTGNFTASGVFKPQVNILSLSVEQLEQDTKSILGRMRSTENDALQDDLIFFFAGARCLSPGHLEAYPWTSGESNHHHQSVRVAKNDALPTPTVQETNWDAQREKACVNTYAHASASQICLQNICGQQQNFPIAGPTFGSKSGPQNGAQAKT